MTHLARRTALTAASAGAPGAALAASCTLIQGEARQYAVHR